MSRIGKRKLVIPNGVTVEVNGGVATVKGPKGTLDLTIDPLVKVEVVDNTLTTDVVKDIKRANVVVGTTNALLNNMLIGVSEGFH